MKMCNSVKSVRPLGGHRLKLVFDDGYVGEVDLWPLFANPKGPLTEPFRDPTFFQKVLLDPETKVVAWPNGYDICSDLLRYYCEQGRVTSDEEMHAYFAVERELDALHDRPSPKNANTLTVERMSATELIADKARQLSEEQAKEVLAHIARLTMHRRWTARELMLLPLEERDRILETQTAKAADLYRTDPELNLELVDPPLDYE